MFEVAPAKSPKRFFTKTNLEGSGRNSGDFGIGRGAGAVGGFTPAALRITEEGCRRGRRKGMGIGGDATIDVDGEGKRLPGIGNVGERDGDGTAARPGEGMFRQMTEGDGGEEEARATGLDGNGGDGDVGLRVLPRPEKVAKGVTGDAFGLARASVAPAAFLARPEALLLVRVGEKGEVPPARWNGSDFKAFADRKGIGFAAGEANSVVGDAFTDGTVIEETGFEEAVGKDEIVGGLVDGNFDRGGCRAV